MANWAYIENGQIVERRDLLPDCWKNISNLYALIDDIEYLKSIGWVKILHPVYEYDHSTQRLDHPSWKLDGDTVIEEWKIVDIESSSLSLTEIEQILIKGAQSLLDSFAQSRGYDSILNACSYVNDPNPKFNQEGSYCVEIRSQMWVKVFEIIDDIKQQVLPMPTSFNEVLPLLPSLTWPE